LTQGNECEQMVAALSKGLVEPKISVVGCGGAGNNVVNSIYWSNKNVETIAVNTDESKLEKIDAHKKILIGKDVTQGQGARGFPEVGEHCADQARGALESVLRGSDIVFIVAGMGGGTGTGAAPVVAEVAKDLNAVTFAIAINPFSYETSRQNAAREGVKRLKGVAENTIVLENDRLLQLAGDLSINESFAIMERSISKLIDSLSTKISEDIMMGVREEVENYFRHKANVEIVPKESLKPVAELVSANAGPRSVDISYEAMVNPQMMK
jgi:cell division protein FtsZ